MNDKLLPDFKDVRSMNNKLTLNVKETAKLLDLSETTLRALVREKKIPHLRIRSLIFFKRDSIEAWLCELQETGIRG